MKKMFGKLSEHVRVNIFQTTVGCVITIFVCCFTYSKSQPRFVVSKFAPAANENFLEMKILRPYLRPIASETLGRAQMPV